jgi:hypothetical protein
MGSVVWKFVTEKIWAFAPQTAPSARIVVLIRVFILIPFCRLSWSAWESEAATFVPG